jgi:type IV pilus assembly protein PilY1
MKMFNKWLKWVLLAAVVVGTVARAEDIDIFAGTTNVDTNLPNVIFVLDNTSNWSRSSQKWPGSIVQGQSEVQAIKTALAGQVGKLNVGIEEYITGGSSGDTDSGYVRFQLQALTSTSVVALDAILDQIYGNINDPTEKRSSSNPYGNLPWDYYNYLSGSNHSNNGTGTPTGTAPAAGGDAAAYTTKWSKFKSPLGSADACTNTYMIFIGNNTNGSIAADSTANSTALKALYTAVGETPPNALAGDAGGTPLAMPGFACTTAPDVVITPAYTTPAYCDADTVTPGATHPAVSVPAIAATSQQCYTTAKQATCTTDEAKTGGACAGATTTLPTSPSPIPSCSCSSQQSDAQSTAKGCKPGTKSSSTFSWNVTRAAYTILAYKDPDTVVKGQCYPAVVHPAVTEPGATSCATTGTSDTTGGKSYNFDDWAKFLHNYGVPLTVTVNGTTYSQRVKVTTYTIDVFNAQQSAALSSLFFSAANAGGGRYFQAKSDAQILAAINSALNDILAVSTSFSAVSLPLSSTNRARVDNQVYIGMFRPAPGEKPRWFGNLKRYQLALFNNVAQLADVNLHSAVNPNTGFATECAQSFWTTDTGNYWENLGVNPAPQGNCIDPGVTTSPWSDQPDGPFVEKGGVGQQTRAVGTTAATTSDARTIYTVNSGGSALRALGTTTGTDATALDSTANPTATAVLDYLRGKIAGGDEVMPATGLRASIHADVVHSRPLSIRYNSSTVRLYYGANDGVYRAVDGANGAEMWGLVVPEHFSKIRRLYDDTPLILYSGAPAAGSVTKDYFFDGATGLISTYDNTGAINLAYIYPTMRRGGRMVYALDVTNPASAPTLLWRAGCPNLTDDTGCTTGFSNIGQTWSMPVGGYVKGYVDGSNNPKLVVFFGGGFDNCLNADVSTYPSACSTAKGKGVYVLDAATGQVLATLPTDAPVISELSPVDIDFDGNIDFAYAADAKGNLYRVNFATMNGANPSAGLTALTSDKWTIAKVAATSDSKHRFYNAPTAGAFQGSVLVAIGTGDRERPLEMNYPYKDNVQNRFYAFFDEPWKTFVANPVGALSANQATTVDLDGSTMLAVVANPPSNQAQFSLQYDGWYMDLPDRGEQVANPAAIAGGKVFFNTFQPGGTSDGLCTRPLGVGTSYTVDAFAPQFTSGAQIDAPGIPIPPVIATVQIPPGLPPCDGANCPTPPADPCASGNCVIKTVCIGCKGFEPIEIVPDATPLRRRVFFTEDIDHSQ